MSASGTETSAVAEGERLLAATREKAARIAGLSMRQVDYWAKTGLVRPSVDERLSPGRRVRLYSFIDLLALSVAAALKAKGASLQHIRAVVDHLKARGYDEPLTELKWAVVGKKVHFQHADGSWEGGLRPDQIVIHEVLNLQPIRFRISEASRRDESLAGQLEQRRGVRSSKPVLAGTRVPVDTVRRYLEAGKSSEEILRSFPVLTEADVDAVRRIATVA